MSIPHKKLLKVLTDAFPDAQIHLKDTVGDENHYSLEIQDSQFKDLSRIQSHKLVNASLKDLMDSGTLHAISISIKTP